MRKCDQDLDSLAADRDVGYSRMLASIPLEPVLQWREQLITDEDVLASQIANAETLTALRELSVKLDDDEAWGQS
jgi:hypothetical protein